MTVGEAGVGACMRDQVFEVFLDEIYESGSFECCNALYMEKRFDGDKDACPEYEEAEIIEVMDVDDVFEIDLYEDLKNRNMDDVLERLHSPDVEKVKDAVASLEGYIGLENDNAYEGLLCYYNGLPAAESLDDVRTRVRTVSALARRPEPDTVHALVNELGRTPSNNMTRQLYTEILKVLGRYPVELIREPVLQLLESKKFAYKIKQRIYGVLEPRWEEAEYDC
jgi:hypothetical protein